MLRLGSSLLLFAGAQTMVARGGPVQDLHVPELLNGPPAAGKRVRSVLPEYKETEVHHILYLPEDWQPNRRFPVIVEYAGNKYKTSLGTVEGSSLGYGISGGEGFIWACLPYVSKDRQRNEVTWWGDLEATVSYCKAAVAQLCEIYGGDSEAVFIAGFSRGAIGCNYIGLHDDEIASLWRGFICHDHYDGVRKWSYSGSDRASAARRLSKLKGRPQYISAGTALFQQTKDFLEDACPKGDFAFGELKGWGHTDVWALHDVPERTALRNWISAILESDGE